MIRRKKIVYLVVAMMAFVGIVGLVKMNKEEFPVFEIKQGLVVGVYPGATSEEVEQQLTRQLEDILFSFKEVDRSLTYSYTRDGMCYIFVDLNVSPKKKDVVWSKIKLKLENSKMSLPPGVLTVQVLDEFSQVSTLLIALESDDKGFMEMQEYADELAARLRKIPETASVRVLGRRNDEIAVTLDMERLATYGISSSSLLLDYQTSSLALPGGWFENDYTRDPVHVKSPVVAENDVAQRIVYSDPTGGVVRMKDVASVERRSQKPDSYVNYNGHTALILSVEMQGNNNIVFYGDDVQEVLDNYKKELPSSVNVSKITDQPKVVEKSVSGFLRDLVIAMLVVIVVMLVLFPLRSALISSSGIPIIIAITTGVMYLVGIPLHTVTLGALITVLGMIVDDSVITMDGYMNKLRSGMARIDAASASVRELFMPMLMATLAISLMFFPMLGIIDGYLGDFIKTFPLVIITALMTSLIYAVLVVPTFMTRFIGLENESKQNKASQLQERFFQFVQRIYEICLRWCFSHTKRTIVIAVAAIALGIFMFLQLNVQMMPMASRDCFAIEVNANPNAPTSVTQAITDSIEHIMLNDRRVVSVTSFVGEGAPRFMATYAPLLPAPNCSQIVVNTKGDAATERILSDYTDSIHNIFPDALIHLKQMSYQAAVAQIEVKVAGPDYAALNPIADSIKAFMLGMGDELQWVHATNDNQLNTVSVALDPDEAARLGVNKSLVTLSVASAFQGSPIASFYENDKAVPVNLYFSSVNGQMDYSTIGNMLVPTAIPGLSVPLRQVASVAPEWHPEELDRFSGEPTVVVSADMKHGKAYTEACKKVKRYVKKEIEPNLPEGVSIKFGGLDSANDVVIPQIMWSFVAAVMVLFLFLFLHFKKFSLALLSVSMSAICLFGASFGLWLFKMDFGITAVLGLISVVGIIIRNGIILFDYAEELRFQHGYSVSDAAFEAGCRRMTPIFLTSVTTALGVLPMIISGGPLWQPMGIIIAFGTMLSIFLIVVVMPVSYKLVFKDHKS